LHPDHQYIEALRNNNSAGIRRLYERYAADALRWVRNNNGSADDARDVFQEAVAILFEKAQNPDFTLTCPIGALLYTLYSRRWIDRLREKKREQTVRLEEEMRYKNEITSDVLSIAESATAEAAQQQRLANTFAQLSEICQRMLKLLAEGIAPKEAALQLEMNSVDTLYRRKNACIGRWRELIH
jgi:RNA polymerase sigma factor (sigma-70 family)